MEDAMDILSEYDPGDHRNPEWGYRNPEIYNAATDLMADWLDRNVLKDETLIIVTADTSSSLLGSLTAVKCKKHIPRIFPINKTIHYHNVEVFTGFFNMVAGWKSHPVYRFVLCDDFVGVGSTGNRVDAVLGKFGHRLHNVIAIKSQHETSSYSEDCAFEVNTLL